MTMPTNAGQELASESLTIEREHSYRYAYAPWSDDNLTAAERSAAFRDHAQRYPGGAAAAIISDAYAEHARREREAAQIAQLTAERRVAVSTATAAKLRAIIQAKVDAERETERLRQRITALETERIDGRDPRMRHIWIQAARKAIEDEHCHEYDSIVDEVGGITRDELRDAGELNESYRVRTHVTVEVYLTIDAHSEDDAIGKVDDLDSGDLRALLRNEVGSVVDNLDLESWDAREADLDD